MKRFPIWHLRHPGGYESLTGVLLENRSLTAADISNSPDVLLDPSVMKDMDRATGRILRAIKTKERIAVFGDYDVDGVTSTALLLDFFDAVGADAFSVLPDRFRDGYGMKPEGVGRALDRKAELIVTADNGISSLEAINLAQQSQVDVVVIDHHQPEGDIPPARAVVDPNRSDCPYGFKGLAAVGLVFKVVQILSDTLMPDASERRRYLNSLLDLVALGTVADVAPMVNENRLLVRRGMQILEQTERPGVKALKQVAGVKGRVDATSIGYFLGPRLNSAGRLTSPDLALDLLRAKTDADARRLANELDNLNLERQKLQQTGLEEAQAQVEAEGLLDHRILVVRGSWHLGIVGLIAGRLTEQHHRPSVICSDVRGNGELTASARTAAGYNIVEAVFRASDLLTEYGGHADAAGFSLKSENFDALKSRLMADADERIDDADLVRRLEIDTVLSPADLTMDTLAILERMGPFGSQNERPRFMLKDCRLASVDAVGKGAHLKLVLQADGQFCNAICWRRGDAADTLRTGHRLDVVGSLEANTWNGKTSLQMVVDDFDFVEEEVRVGGG